MEVLYINPTIYRVPHPGAFARGGELCPPVPPGMNMFIQLLNSPSSSVLMFIVSFKRQTVLLRGMKNGIG